METFQSWGRVQRQAGTLLPAPQGDDFALPAAPFLPVGLGRSYGDVCLNHAGSLLPMRSRSAILAADWAAGWVHAGAGLALGDLIETCLPRGWFPPVLPGTRHVTVAGAIANDVHGKNHHRAGTFGHHVARLRLRRSDRAGIVECSPELEPGLFHATIGGLGLTGVIVSAEIQLRPVNNGWMEVEFVPFGTLEEFAGLTAASDADWDYTVAWVDLIRARRDRLAGIFMRGNHAEAQPARPGCRPPQALFRWPVDLPFCPFNRFTAGAFNRLYHARQLWRKGRFHQYYGGFFHPLDVVDDWNRLYGRNGFFQYQFVVPFASGLEPFREVFDLLFRTRTTAPLAVLKQTGSIHPTGLLSFPRPGWTLAMDVPNHGPPTRELLARLDAIVESAGGRLYPAKDAAMGAAFFQRSYPAWRDLEALRDPAIRSDFWQRVTGPIS